MNARFLSLALALPMAISLASYTTKAAAAEGGFEPPGTLEFGSGVMVSNVSGASNKAPVQGLFKVNVSYGTRTNEDYFIWAKIKGSASTDGDTMRYVDVTLEGATYGQGHADTYWGITAVKANLYKNLDLGQGLTARIQFLGVQGSVGTKVIEQVEVYFKGALELIGMSLDANHASIAKSVGFGAMGGSVEVGARLFKTFRIAFGGSFGNEANNPLSYMQNPNCQSTLDGSGNTVIGCSNSKQVTKQLQFTAAFAAASWLTVGAQANYVIYQKDGQDDATAWQALFTASILPSAFFK